MKLNPGIVRTVAWLRANGFNTCDSGDGKTHDYECDLPVPYIHSQLDDPEKLVPEARRLARLLAEAGVQIGYGPKAVTIEASYSPVDGFAHVSVFNLCDEILP